MLTRIELWDELGLADLYELEPFTPSGVLNSGAKGILTRAIKMNKPGCSIKITIVRRTLPDPQ
jgi:hypothetical protein